MSLPLLEMQAQYREEEESKRGKFFLMPEFGLFIGSVTSVEGGLSLGYHVTHRLSAGVGGRYEYYMDSRDYPGYTPYSTHIAGYRLFSRFTLIEDLGEWLPLGAGVGIVAHGEYEGLNLESQYFDVAGQYPGQDRFWNHAFLAGGGITQGSGGRTAFNLLVLWDTGGSGSSLYPSPVMRVGMIIYLN